MFVVGKIFFSKNFFWGKNAHHGCINLIRITVKSYLNKFLFEHIICDGKAEFSASLLQSLVSHDPSEIILMC